MLTFGLRYMKVLTMPRLKIAQMTADMEMTQM
jgi:hypothetical protein